MNAGFSSSFDKTFQERLSELILRDGAFADRLFEVLDVNYFEYKYLQYFARKIYDYKKEYDVHPSLDIMSSVLSTSFEEEDISDSLRRKVEEFFCRIKDKGLSAKVEDAEYVKEQAIAFCKKQDMKVAFHEGLEIMQEGGSYDQIESVIKESVRKGKGRDVGHRYIEDFESRYDERQRQVIPTGWDVIDDITEGGHGKEELGVCIGATGAGKSMFLTYLGANALTHGKNVVHYTLELNDRRIGKRYDACLTNTSLNKLDENKEETVDMIKEVEGDLIIKQYPTKKATPHTLQHHIERLQRNDKEVDMVVVDYGDLLAPVEKEQTKRDNLQSIYQDLRGLASELNVAVWTASQTNRDGLNKEVVTMEEISEAYSKCFVSDFIFTIARTLEDKDMGTGRINVTKNRNGPDGIVFPMLMDPATVNIEVLSKDSQTVEQLRAERQKEIAQNVEEKFKKFKKQ